MSEMGVQGAATSSEPLRQARQGTHMVLAVPPQARATVWPVEHGEHGAHTRSVVAVCAELTYVLELPPHVVRRVHSRSDTPVAAKVSNSLAVHTVRGEQMRSLLADGA